ncbi:MAG: hypothetical protein AAF558_05890 [Verrucomicrobiota bacterium]
MKNFLENFNNINWFFWFYRGTGLALLIHGIAWLPTRSFWLGQQGFHPSASAWSAATGASLLSPLPPVLIDFTYALFLVGCLNLVHGRYFKRITAMVLALGLTLATLTSPSAFGGVNGIFVFSLLVVATTSDNRTRLQISRYAVIATLIAIYTLSGWRKAVWGTWLTDPNTLYAVTNGLFRTGLAAWSLQTLPAFVWTALQYAVLTFQLASPLLFGFQQTRILAIGLGLGFHLSIALYFEGLWLFNLGFLSLYFAFLEPKSR